MNYRSDVWGVRGSWDYEFLPDYTAEEEVELVDDYLRRFRG